MNIPMPPLRIQISKTADGKQDYLQILSSDQFSLNIVLISSEITVTDGRIPPSAARRSGKVICAHDRLNEDGICRACGADCRGIG